MKCLGNQNTYLRKPLVFTSSFIRVRVSSRSQTTSLWKTPCQINTWESLPVCCTYKVLISYSLKSFSNVFPSQSHSEMNKIPHFTESKTDPRGDVSCPVMGEWLRTSSVEGPTSPQFRALLTRPRLTWTQVKSHLGTPFFLPTLLRAPTQRYV